MADITPARKLFDLLVSRDFDPEMLDSSGKPAPDPAEAEIFSFDFRAQSGKDYGTVVVMLGNDNDLEIYCSDNVGRSMEGDDKNNWFAFLEQLKNFAVRNFMSFGIKNLNRLRYSMQGQAAIKEGLFESWTGNRTTSWNGAATEARLMIRHKKNIAEGDARFRHIESLFIETVDSERYKLPFKSLTAGRAMLEHVRQGGRPYDPRGNHIAEMVTELNVLSRFRRANQGQIFEGDTAQLVEQVQEYQTNLQRSLKGLGTRTGYTTYFESWSPADISEQDVVIESLKNLFVKQSIDTRIESALPLLARIQQQGTAMKEANIFEAWAERLVEGTWQTPDTPEKQARLVELMSTDLPVGADATNVTEQLYDLLGDDELFDQLEALAEQDANADARQVIYDRMQMLSDNPDVLKVIEQLQIDPTAEMNPPEATNPADLEPMNESLSNKAKKLIQDYRALYPKIAYDSDGNDMMEPEEAHDETCDQLGIDPGVMDDYFELEDGQGLTESRLMDAAGETIDHILNRFKHEVKTFEQGADMDQDLYHALFDYWNDAGEIPYGIAKGRTGDPMEWVANNLESHLNGGGIVGGTDWSAEDDIERESVMHGDYAEEKSRMRKLAGMQDEGAEGTTGQIIKKLLDPLSQGLAGGGGKSLSIPLVGEEETDEGAAAQSIGDKIGSGLGTVGGAVGGGMLGGPAGMLGGAVAGNLAGGAIGSKIGAAVEEDEMEEGELGTGIGAGLGGIVGGIPGAALGGIAGHYLSKDKETNEGSLKDIDWKEVAGSTAGGTAGYMAGSAVGGPIAGLAAAGIGSAVGGALAKDDQKTTEGVRGALAGGALGGAATRSVKGAVAGAKLGSAIQDRFAKKEETNEDDASLFDDATCNMSEAGESCPVHGVKECYGSDDASPLAGQYGHSGKMKEVGKETSFLDRLKELSGMIRN